MIKAKKGEVVLNGYPTELLGEYRNITKSMIDMLESDGLDKEQIKRILTNVVEAEFLTKEELEEKIHNELNELSKVLQNTLDEIFGGKEKEGEDNE